MQWEAMLITYLSTRVISLPFDNLQTLLENTDYRIILMPESSFEDVFRQSTDPVRQKAYQENIKPNIELMKTKSSSWVDHAVNMLKNEKNIAIYSGYSTIE